MNAATVNVPLLRKAVEWAEAEAAKPEIDREWDQRDFVSTPWRVAGRMAGACVGYGDAHQALRENLAPHCGTAYCIAGYVGQMLEPAFAEADINEATGQHVQDFAAEALGLGYDQASRLFRAGNSIEDVRRIAEHIAGERL